MSLSDSLIYQPKPSAVSSSEARWNQPSYNKSTFNPDDVVMINIPTGRCGSFLNTRMSYLKFRVTNYGTDAAPHHRGGLQHCVDYLKAGAISWIESFQIHKYGLLVNLRHDI